MNLFRLSLSTREKIKDLIFRQQGRLGQHSIETIKVEKTVGCDGRPRWQDIRKFANSQTYPFLEWRHPSETVYRYHLQDIIVDAYHMVFFKNGKVIPNSNPFITGDLLHSITIDSEKLIDVRDQGVIFSCSDHWENNYYHWIVHAIPAYFAAMESGIKGKFFLPYPLMEWRKRSLELLGIDLALCYPLEKEKQYRVSQLYAFDYPSGKVDFSCSALSVRAYAKMKQNIRVPDPLPLQHEKIYISRLGKDNRHLSNETALIEALQKRGYFILNPEAYNLDEQIMLFHHAKIVVALLGAGLSNIAFCQEGTLVYELIPSHHDNPCFLALSLQGKLHYWADRFDTGVDNAGPDHLSPWQKPLDIALVMQRLDELESRFKTPR